MLCHNYRCIFVPIPKTAGESVEQLFLQRLGLSASDRPHLLLQPNDDPALGPPRLAHLTAGQYVECGHISADQFASYLKFAVVRNPWDRLVSLFHYLEHARTTDFNDFLFNHFYRALWRDMYWFVRPQSDFIFDPSGRPLVDNILRFETLDADFYTVATTLGFSGASTAKKVGHHDQAYSVCSYHALPS